jgi:hypothetical protein
MISHGGREFHIWHRWYIWFIASVIRHYLAPRLRSGAALRCQCSAWGICDMQHVCNLQAWKRWRSSRHYALSDDWVTMTKGPLNPINDTECLENWARFRRFARKMFRNCKWLSNFSVLCECCWWKLLVRCKTLIYCGQLCNSSWDGIGSSRDGLMKPLSVSFWVD